MLLLWNCLWSSLYLDVDIHVLLCDHIPYDLDFLILLCGMYNVCNDLCNHSLLVPTDLTVTTSRLMELFQSVNDPTGFIGGLLGLPESAKVEIQRSFQTASQLKEAYLDAYAHHHPCPSWIKVVKVLQRCHLGQQASEVEDTYVQGMHGVDQLT